jgi:hypothetical protein
MDPILPKVGASGKPGAVQTEGSSEPRAPSRKSTDVPILFQIASVGKATAKTPDNASMSDT